jgi:hypothetical protein
MSVLPPKADTRPRSFNVRFVPEADIARITFAMQHGLANHVLSDGELVQAALHGTIAEPVGRRQNRFTVIDGGAA